MRRLLIAPLILAAACVPGMLADDAGRLLEDAGDALADAGTWLRDAGSVHGQPSVSVPCTVVAERVVSNGAQETRTRYWGAFMPSTEGSTAEDLLEIEAVTCHRSSEWSDPPCPSGFTCSGNAPLHDCQEATVSLHRNQAFVGCGNDQIHWQDVTFIRRP